MTAPVPPGGSTPGGAASGGGADEPTAGLGSTGGGSAAEAERLAEQWRRRYDDVRTRVASARVTGSSPDGGVRVEMAAGNNVVGVRFTDDALRRPPAALEAAVMAAIGAASTEMARVMREAVGPYLGDVDAGAVASGGVPGGLAAAFEADYRRRHEGEGPTGQDSTPQTGAALTDPSWLETPDPAPRPPAPRGPAPQTEVSLPPTGDAAPGGGMRTMGAAGQVDAHVEIADEEQAPGIRAGRGETEPRRRAVPPPDHGRSRVQWYDEEDDA